MRELLIKSIYELADGFLYPEDHLHEILILFREIVGEDIYSYVDRRLHEIDISTLERIHDEYVGPFEPLEDKNG